MRLSLKTWLATVGLAAGLNGTVLGQTPQVPMLPATPPPPMMSNAVPIAELLPRLPESPMPQALPDHLTSDVGPTSSPSLLPNWSNSTASAPRNDCPMLGPNQRVWLNYTTLLLWFQPARTPFNLANANQPGRPARVALDGQQELGMVIVPRFSGGVWLNRDRTVALSLDGFISEDRSLTANVTGNATNRLTIVRPFIDAVTGERTELLVANSDPSRGPTNLVGSMSQTSIARFSGAGVHVRRNQVYDASQRFDVFFGFRYYDLSESLTLNQTTQIPQDNLITIANQRVAGGSTLTIQDRSFTRNQFWGAELGSHWEYKFDRAFFSFTPRVGLGSIHQVTQLHGETSSSGTTAIEPVAGGLLAAGRGPSNGNLGRFVTNRFGLSTDLNSAVGYNITENFRFSVGYQFFYLNNVARPGKQFDQTINTRVVPVSTAFGSISGPRAPNVTFDREGFYAHGASILFEASY